MRKRTMLIAGMMLLVMLQSVFAASILVVDDDNNYNNESRLYAALDDDGISYDTYDCSAEGVSPDSSTMLSYDLVIWFTGSDGGGTYFWNTSDSDNVQIKGFLNNGGKMWAFGVDLLYDRYGSAADTFAVGDFAYDYMGLSSYDAQSHTGLDSGGVPQLDETADSISTVNPIQWTVAELNYVDGVSLVESAVAHYVMGPDSYVYAGLSTVQSYTTDTFTFLSSFFKIYNFDTNANRDTWVGDVINWFDLPQDTLATFALEAPVDGSGFVLSTLTSSGLDLIWEDNAATSYDLYLSRAGVALDSVMGLSDTTYSLDYATLETLLGADDYATIDWNVTAHSGTATLTATEFSFSLSAQEQLILVVDDDDYQNYEYSLYESLERSGYVFDTWDASVSGGSPDAATLNNYDLVIWYSGSDGADLYFWDGTDSDNPALMSYLDNGGRLWINGLDLLYDRFGGAPDAFAPGDFAYDYMGLASYDVQSRLDDGSLGAPLIAQLPDDPISAVDTISWRFSTAWYIDGVTSNYRSFDNYVMGPDDYVLAGKTNVCHTVGNGFVVLNSFFNYNHIASDSLRDALTAGIMDWFGTVAAGNVPTAAVLSEPAVDQAYEIFVSDSGTVDFIWDAATDVEGSVAYRFLVGDDPNDLTNVVVADLATPGYSIAEHDLYTMIPIGSDSLQLYWQVLAYDEDHNFSESVINPFIIVRDAGSGPAPFALISPADGAMLRLHEDNPGDEIFSWSTSVDPDGMPVSYAVNFMDAADSIIYTVAATDTAVSISSADLLAVLGDNESLDLTWSVTASDGDLETAALVPFALRLVHALPQEISILVVDDDDRYNNETKVYTALDDDFYAYDTYDCVFEGAAPTASDLAPYDLVIWFAGSDGVGLYFWNTTDEDNAAIPEYLDGGGRIWAWGADILYDRYGSAPDFFGPGDMIYDYFGTGAYLAQSWANDDNVGVPMLIKDASSAVTAMDTLYFGGSLQVHKYADGCALGAGAMSDLYFGPADYQLAGMANSYHATDGNFITMSTWFNPYYMVDDADRAQFVGDAVAWFANTMEPDTLAAPVLTAPATGSVINLDALDDTFEFSWNTVTSEDPVVYQLIVTSNALDIVPIVKTTTGTSVTLSGDDLFDLAGSGTDELTLTWQVTAQTAMAAYAQSEPQTHEFIEGINEAPLDFELLLPVANDTLRIETVDQSFTFTWTPAVDPEDDPLNYQFLLISAADTMLNVTVADTSVTFNAEDIIAMMGTETSVITFWKVFAQDGEFSTGSEPRILHLENNVVSIVEAVIPTEYQLYQNYPNPFNPTTTIRYDLPEAADIQLTIYDITGRVVNQLAVGSQAAGSYCVRWNGNSTTGLRVSTGVYLCRIQSAAYSEVIKMLYLK